VVVEKGMENKGEQRRTKVSFQYNHDASIGAAAVGKKACFKTKQCGSVKKSGL